MGATARRRWSGARRRLMIAGGVFLAALLIALFARSGDVASGQPFRVSSAAAGAASSGRMTVRFDTNALIRTTEMEQPWVEVDLGRVRSVGRVVVYNRSDCCFETSVPLLIEVSGEPRGYRTVARRDDTFRRWDARFKAQQARYIRVKMLKKGELRLDGVRVY